MKIKKENNFAFIDGQNLNLSIKELGWKLDFKRFFIYLKEKYNIKKAYYFIGLVDDNGVLYKFLQECGFILIFKPTLKNPDGKVKGNCDAELVLQAMIDFKEYDKAVIVTGDGDFTCLVRYFIEQNKLKTVLVPNKFKYSSLLRIVTQGRYLAFMNDLKSKLSYNNKKKRAS